MSVVRFLFTPRWMGLLVVVIVLGFTCVKLSEWQFGRYQERKDSNTLVRNNLAAPPVPAPALLSTAQEPSSNVEWRTVTVTGHYDAAHQVAVLYRTLNGQPGVDVVTPLITTSGKGILVDRGWVSSPANGNLSPRLPAPTAGTVTVSGWVRADATGGSDQLTPSQGSVRAISSPAIGASFGYPVYRGFLELTKEQPASPAAPQKASEPDLSGGPSFFYGFQWLFFALLFFGFWIYFAYAEYQEKVRGRDTGRAARPRRKPWRPGADAEDYLDDEPVMLEPRSSVETPIQSG